MLSSQPRADPKGTDLAGAEHRQEQESAPNPALPGPDAADPAPTAGERKDQKGRNKARAPKHRRTAKVPPSSPIQRCFNGAGDQRCEADSERVRKPTAGGSVAARRGPDQATHTAQSLPC